MNGGLNSSMHYLIIIRKHYDFEMSKDYEQMGIA